jgi:hypothetical protein
MGQIPGLGLEQKGGFHFWPLLTAAVCPVVDQVWEKLASGAAGHEDPSHPSASVPETRPDLPCSFVVPVHVSVPVTVSVPVPVHGVELECSGLLSPLSAAVVCPEVCSNRFPKIVNGIFRG